MKMSSKEQNPRKSQSRGNKGKTTRSREAIKNSKINLRLDLEPPKGSQVTPKRPPRAPKRSPESSKTASRTSSKIKGQSFENKWMFKLKSTFLRFRRPYLELKIDPKSLQGSTSTTVDEDIAKRNGKKDNMMRIYWNHVPPQGPGRFVNSEQLRNTSPGEA